MNFSLIYANIFNKYFTNIMESLDIRENPNIITLSDHIDGLIAKSILKYCNHPSIQMNNDNCITPSFFSFSNVDSCVINDIINKLDTKKASSGSIPVKIFKENVHVFLKYFTDIINDCLDKTYFPDELKLADISPVLKKDDVTDKCNYRPISLLPPPAKVFEKICEMQINSYMENKLSKYLCGFRKGYSTQLCLLVMIEKIKKAIDSKGFAGVLLTDLSKAFDCINHELLIAKLNAYGFSESALNLIGSYLSNRKQRTKINSSFS